MLIRTLLVLGVAAPLLVACGSGDQQDIRQWMQEQAKGLKGRAPDVPEIRQLAVLAYEPGELTPPFSIDKLFAEEAKAGGRGGVAGGPKPINPDAQPMVKYPLDAIRLYGTIMVGKELRALVAAEREPVRQVRVGDYLGQNSGRIVSIVPATEDIDARIVLKETVLDKGVWVERDTQIPAQDKGDKK
jgi:type IV pilus assembly protein PilP